jgi:sulfotransferase family protein
VTGLNPPAINPPAARDMHSQSGKIFGIGLSRTGTTSLTEALETLGFKAYHFPLDAVSRREITEFLLDPSESLTLSVLSWLDALTDTPICCTYRALDRAYPGSRFVFTTRDKASWIASCKRYWADRLKPILEGYSPDIAVYVHLINRTVYGAETFDPELFSQAYDSHVASVQHYFRDRPKDLLALDICDGDGWSELCEFLEVAEPDATFPHENARKRQRGRSGFRIF